MILDTNSLVKKLFWLSCTVVLVYYSIFLSYLNLLAYQANDVVTQVKVIDNQTLTFPAVTICLIEYYFRYSPYSSELKIPKMNDAFVYCYFDNLQNQFKLEDFEYVPIYAGPFWDKNFDCYKFNGRGSGSEIRTSTKFGWNSGLNLYFNLTKNQTLFYYIGDTDVQPTERDLTKQVQQNVDKRIYIELKKSVDIKLPKPYSNCTDNINTETSHLVREIIQKNITYRQKYCYELCYKDRDAEH